MIHEAPDTLLGKNTPAPNEYSPDILVRIPRDLERKKNMIDLSFVGGDIWHCHECYCQTEEGPITFELMIVVHSDSAYMVESKSLKLYLHSLSNMMYGKTRDFAIKYYADVVKRDLSKLLAWNVFVHTDNGSAYQEYELEYHYRNLDTEKEPALNYYWKNFRSLCRVTSQPDFATIFFEIEGAIDFSSELLKKFLSSMRNENHFHEEAVELIYDHFWNNCAPKKLLVGGNFTRRGGISISPVRSTHEEMISLWPQLLWNQ
jgi:7-cyano-7-deazaguanine reductase